MKNVYLALVGLWGCGSLLGCGGNKHDFQLLPDSQSFRQNSETIVQKKLDILWVVDNSGSMQPFQDRLTQNFKAFIGDISSRDFDFHIGVTTTDAFLAEAPYNRGAQLAALKNGNANQLTGFSVIDNKTPHLEDVFATNATQGISGSGDERAFSSMQAALRSPLNRDFLRQDSFLAVIILSDEDDFSSATRLEGQKGPHGKSIDHDYEDPDLHSVQKYVGFLDELTKSQNKQLKNYNVSVVSIINESCSKQAGAQGAGRIVAKRYVEIAKTTNGVMADICSQSYSVALSQIQHRIVELSTQFKLNRIPKENSLIVEVDQVLIANSQSDGWTFDSASNSILFHGSALPRPGATINVRYDPLGPL